MNWQFNKGKVGRAGGEKEFLEVGWDRLVRRISMTYDLCNLLTERGSYNEENVSDFYC